MDILPAIDLRNGKCVRLLQGDYTRQINYSDDPVAQACQFEQQGASWLHIVDLDGALQGKPFNINILHHIRKKTKLNIQIGGGVRTEDSVKTLLSAGINRTIIGTKACEDLAWFRDLVWRYPRQIALGLDARHYQIAIRGWTETSDLDASGMIQIVNDWPLAAIVYTDISRDGMLTGPNIETTRQLAQNCKPPLIASGGVSQLQDIKQLARLPITGIIVGRALYEAKINLTEAITIANRYHEKHHKPEIQKPQTE